MFIPTAATGNGFVLGTFGATGEVMGFFYPRIDFAQNVREGMPAIRFLGGAGGEPFQWTFAPCWRAAQSFEPASNVLITRLAHRDMLLYVEISDVIPPGERALFRRVVITKDRAIGPVQFMHYFRLVLGDSNTRNGVQFYPGRGVVVQHFRDVAIALSATEPFSAQCGSIQPGQESPTKRAMAEGNFGTSPQSIGRVDFAVGFEPVVAQRWQTTIVLAAAPTRDQAMGRATALARLDFEHAVRSANDRVAAELADAGSCVVPELTDAFERAVISLHDLYDESQGTFIAAPEFDPGFQLSGGYGYCWPRDAAVCALAAQRIGRPQMARRFFEWSAATQLSNGHWYQRYWTDGSPAPSWCVLDDEIQLDQTCAIVHAAGLFARRLSSEDGSAGESSLSLEARTFVDSYRPVVERATRAILDYVGPDYLHRKATDLWENSTGLFAYTQAGVIAALREVDEVFAIDRQRTGAESRSAMRKRLIDVFWQPDRRRWLRRITPEGAPDATLDSSAIGVIDPWGVLDLSHPADRRLAMDTLDGVSQDLRATVKAGSAILRFAGESYMGGGPGCVNTLWLALCRLRLAATAGDTEERREQRRLAIEDIRVTLANTSPTGQLPELIPKIEAYGYWAAPHAWACSLLIEAALLFRKLDGDAVTSFDLERARVRRQAPSH